MLNKIKPQEINEITGPSRPKPEHIAEMENIFLVSHAALIPA